MKIQTSVPVLMDKRGTRIGICRLSQIFILRMWYNIKIKRTLSGDEGPFLCHPRLPTQRPTEKLVDSWVTEGGDKNGIINALILISQRQKTNTLLLI